MHLTLKTFLLAVTAAAALIGAAVVGVPTTADRANEPAQYATRAD